MYGEIIRELMRAKTIGIIIDIVLFVIALVLIYFFSVRPAKAMTKIRVTATNQAHDLS